MADSVTVTRRTESPTPAQRREMAEELRRQRLPRQFWDPNYYADPRNAQAARSIAHPALGPRELTVSEFNRLQIAAQGSMISPNMVNTMIDVLSASPTVSPGVATALSQFASQAQLGEGVKERILTLDAEARALEAQVTAARNPDQGSEAEKGGWLSNLLQNISRPALALLSMPLEIVQGQVRQTWGRITGEEEQVERWDTLNQIPGGMGLWAGAALQSAGGQYLAGVVDGPGGISADLGSGWLPRGDVLARQEQAKRDAAPLVFNEHWTLGRGIASLVFDNGDSLQYNNLSGMIDIVGAIVMDPLVVFGGLGAIAQSVRQGGNVARGIELGQAAAAQGITREAIEISEGTARALQQAQRISDQTLDIANQVARDSNHLYAQAQRGASTSAGQGALAESALRVERLNAQIGDAQLDLAAARRNVSGERMRASTAEDPEGAALLQTEAAAAVDQLTMQLGDDGLDAMMAKVTADSPELPGAFTDAVFVPGKRTNLQPNALPGTDGGADSIILWRGEKTPNLRSVDDAIDTDLFTPLLRSRVQGGERNVLGSNARQRLADVITRPNATYADLIDVFIAQGRGQELLNVFKGTDIDGITDIFRLTGGEGGVWWTTTDAHAIRWTDEAGEGAWRTYDGTVGQAQERIKSLRAELRAENKLQADLRRRGDIEQQMVGRLADQYVSATDLRTSIYDSQEAIRNAVEYSMGVRRSLGGKPQISHQELRDWLFGPTREFDEVIAAKGGMSTSLEAAEHANRAMLALTTMGVSELPRVARKLVEPFATRAREATLDAMIKLDYSPKNLGLLQRLSNGKIDPDILKAVLNATNEDEVLEVLGPAVGIDIVRPIGPNVINALPMRLNRITGGAANDSIFRRAAEWAVDWVDRAGSVAPRFGAHINFADPMSSAQVLRNYLTNIPHISTEFADEMVGRYMDKTTEVGRARALTSTGGIMDKVADEIIEYQATIGRWSDDTRATMRDAIRSATRVYEGGRAQVNDYWLSRYANDAKIGFRTQDGEIVPYVGPQLEAELARGGVLLPNTDEIRRSIGRWGAAVQQRPILKNAIKGMDVVMDWWRSAVLFRLAYTVRNIGEMQFRMFLTGHTSVFGQPLSALAMASAMNKRTTFSKGLFSKFTEYDKTASGRELGPIGDDALEATDNALGEFIELINRSGSYHDERSLRAVEQGHQLRSVGVDQPGFTKGWAEELIKLRSDRLARIVAGQNPPGIERVLALGIPREQAVVDWLIHSPGAAGMRREFAETESTLAQIFSDPIMLKDFLFDSPASVKARIQEYTAGGQAELVDFIVTGQLSRNGKQRFSMSTHDPDPVRRMELMETRATRLAGGLRDFMDSMPEDYALTMRVVVGEGRNPRNPLRRGLDAFFDWNGRKENAWAMGPEFSYAFNDAMIEMMPSLNRADRQKVFEFVENASTRHYLRQDEALIKARNASRAPGDGPLTMLDAEKYATQKANDHVRGLFYDATNRKQLFHSLRLAMPFAQPFADTLWRWGRLMAARPYMIEKFGRLSEALTSQGSGVIYDDFDWIDPFSNRETRDPTQGFIYTDPQTGEAKFTFPLIGSALGAVLSPVAGFNLAESMTLTAPVQNLNLAFQGDVDYLPGLGPLISFPLAQIMPDDWFGAFPEWLRDYAFPYGEPNPSQGVIESTALPSWLRRLTGTMWNEDFRSYSYKGVMAYMVSTKEYPGLAGSPEVQQELIDDIQAGSKWMTFIRALGAAVLPAAPTQEIYAADKDGRLIGSTYLAAHWHHLLQESNNDYEASTKAFIDSYGMQALAAILPSSEGEFAISGPGWEWYKEHAGEADAYSDVVGYFFPGDFSLEAYSFQQGSGDRERLSPEQRTDRMIQFMYDAEKTQLEGRAAREEWDVNQMDDAEEDLKMRYGGVIPSFTGVDSRSRLDQIRRAITQFDDLAKTRAGEGAQLLFEAYDEYSAASEERYGSGLASIKAEPLRQEFLNELDAITAQYGGWNEKDGSVTNISRLFVNVVTPRGE